MATRATYRFFERDREEYFYVHWGNSPRGAANYLDKMLKLKSNCIHQWGKTDSQNKYFSDFFILCDSGIQHTKGHENHLDTEYRYNIIIENRGIIHIQCLHFNSRSGKFDSIYSGSLDNFYAEKIQ